MPSPRYLSSGLVALWLAVPLLAHAEPVEVTDSARQHFEAGVHFLQDPDGSRDEEAYREFKAAYAESPSWKILGNFGIAAMRLERDGEAIDAFERYLAEGGTALDRGERAQFERDLETLKTSVVWVTITLTPNATALTDERIPVRGVPTINRYAVAGHELRLGLRPGHHRIVAQLEGHQDASWEFDAQPGKEQRHDFELVPIAPEPAPAPLTPPAPSGAAPSQAGSSSLGLYVGLGVTGALALGGGVAALLASAKHGEYDDINDGTRPARARQLRQSGERLNLAADLLLGGAVVAGGVTTVLYFMRGEPAPAGAESVEVSGAWLPGGGTLSVSGGF